MTPVPLTVPWSGVGYQSCTLVGLLSVHGKEAEDSGSITSILRPRSRLFVQREIQVRGSRGRRWDFQRAIELVKRGKIDLKALISHQLPLSELPRAFEILLDPKQEANKVVIQMG